MPSYKVALFRVVVGSVRRDIRLSTYIHTTNVYPRYKNAGMHGELVCLIYKLYSQIFSHCPKVASYKVALFRGSWLDQPGETFVYRHTYIHTYIIPPYPRYKNAGMHGESV